MSFRRCCCKSAVSGLQRRSRRHPWRRRPACASWRSRRRGRPCLRRCPVPWLDAPRRRPVVRLPPLCSAEGAAGTRRRRFRGPGCSEAAQGLDKCGSLVSKCVRRRDIYGLVLDAAPRIASVFQTLASVAGRPSSLHCCRVASFLHAGVIRKSPRRTRGGAAPLR